jgi:hypothetical protein
MVGMSESRTMTEKDTAASRTARERQAARDRARRWREERQAEVEALRAEVEAARARITELEGLVTHAEVDALVVAGLARAIARAPTHRTEVPVAGTVAIPAILDQCGKAGRAAGADYAACALAAGGRIQGAVRQFTPTSARAA